MDKLTFWTVYNSEHEEVVHYRKEENARKHAALIPNGFAGLHELGFFDAELESGEVADQITHNLAEELEYMRGVLASVPAHKVAKFFGAWTPDELPTMKAERIRALFEEFGDVIEKNMKRNDRLPPHMSVDEIWRI